MAYLAQLIGESVVDKKGHPVDLAKDCAAKTIGIYFSAHWCPPCRGFTPVLAQFYNLYKESKNFEIIFVSSDRTETSFNQYYSEMPWLALSYKNNKKMNELCNTFNVDSIPTLVLLNSENGELYNKDAVKNVTDSKLDSFPWKQ